MPLPLLTLLAALLLMAQLEPAKAEADAALKALAEDEAVLILRHAQTVPGTGDPPGFRLDDCSTQRNLSARGRDQAKQLGAALRAAGIEQARVLSSPWCRAQETAELLGLGPVDTWPVIASIWNDRITNPDRTEELRVFILNWEGPGPLILVSHGINVSRLLNRSPTQGGGFVLQQDPDAPGGFTILGALP